MKLNYTSLQHAVRPGRGGLEEAPPAEGDAGRGARPARPAALRRVRALGAAPGVRVGYVQTAGGALPGALSDTVADLLERGMLADHVTAAPCFGGRREAITVEGALDAGGAWAGTARSWARAPGSSARPRRSATAAWRRCRTRTRRWRSAAPSCSCRGSPAATRASATAASATTRRPCSSCSCARRVPLPEGLSLPASAALGARSRTAGMRRAGVDVTELVEAYLRAACRPRRWAARSTRTGTSSSPAWPAGRCSHR